MAFLSLAIAGAALQFAAALDGIEPDPRTAERVFDGLSGSCWQADIGQGAFSVHCYIVAESGRLVMEIQTQRSGGEQRWGSVVLYRSPENTASDVLDYVEVTSFGAKHEGFAAREGDTIIAWSGADQRHQPHNVIVPNPAENEYRDTPLKMATRVYVRVGPAGEGALKGLTE